MTVKRGPIFTAENLDKVATGRKTQTRRMGKELRQINKSPSKWHVGAVKSNIFFFIDGPPEESPALVERFPKYEPGDLLWLPEKWRVAAWNCNKRILAIDYADGTRQKWISVNDRVAFDRLVDQTRQDAKMSDFKWKPGESPGRWRPSTNMAQWAARHWIKITGVRAEKLGDISEADAKAEGVDNINDFASIWEKTNKKGFWPLDKTRWCFVYEFKLADAPEGEGAK
jgi:hypothetical protein